MKNAQATSCFIRRKHLHGQLNNDKCMPQSIVFWRSMRGQDSVYYRGFEYRSIYLLPIVAIENWNTQLLFFLHHIVNLIYLKPHTFGFACNKIQLILIFCNAYVQAAVHFENIFKDTLSILTLGLLYCFNRPSSMSHAPFVNIPLLTFRTRAAHIYTIPITSNY